MTHLPQVLIIELGSQYTLLIERTLRESGVRSVVLNPERAGQWLERNPVKAIILSGGAASVYDHDAPQPPSKILFYRRPDGSPVFVFGICYGMQWIAKHLNGDVQPVSEQREYGQASITVTRDASLFKNTPAEQTVWASHGDSVVRVPDHFETIATTNTKTIAAMVNEEQTIWGVQFHPEVKHSEHGARMLMNFLELSGCQKDWEPSSLISEIQMNASAELGEGKVICGFSGGVDSTTLTAIVSPILKNRLRCVAIDGGQLRENEMEEIIRHAKAAGVELQVIDAHHEFAAALKDVVDAEEKRKRFSAVYVECLLKAAEAFGATAILQGTLAPDRIESGATGGAKIKKHHNVDNDMGGLKQIHPIDHLFKYEVRALANSLGLPESVWKRQPFPGPGLFVRVVGTPATSDKLEIVRWADAQVRDILKQHQADDQLSQLVVAYIGVNTVGVKGDDRVYGDAIVVRAVQTVDFMTATGVHFAPDIEDEITTTLTKHPDIIRVWFDFTQKPPATTELE